MTKTFFIFLMLTVTASSVLAQPQSREQLEKQRQELKKEIEQTEKMLQKNKAETKESLLQWKLISQKVNLQGRVIDNISKDLNVLNNNIYTIQKDINRYNRVLDTLKQEYAKSMVYAYKNRSNYDFLNFIFSASDFNDAIKRITYLKSYRNYREMQGENILRTQEQRRKRIAELNGAKVKKNETLKEQSKEMSTLATEQKEKDRILAGLKKQGKQLNQQIAAKQKQMKKVNSAIAAAIKRAQEEAMREARLKAEREKAAAAKAAAAATPGTPAKPAPKPEKPVRKAGESVLLNEGNIALNNSFERNKGSLPWPVDRGTVLMHFGNNTLPSGSTLVNPSVTIASDIGSSVKAVFNGTVSVVQSVDEMQVVIIQHGRYFTTYSNLSGVSVSKGQDVTTGQTIGRVAPNFDGIGVVDFLMSNEVSNFDPETWLRKR
jgi:septal ring factor EnvC (AmiA/AmiB activator)